MIPEIFSTNEKKLKNFFKGSFKIYEKLDMYYFKVYLFSDICIPVFAKTGKAISYEDSIINSLYDDILEFVKSKIDIPEFRKKFYSKYGFSKIGFYYYPGITNNHIIYFNVHPKSFFISDIWTTKAPKIAYENFEDFVSYSYDIHKDVVYSIPLIAEYEKNSIDDLTIDTLFEKRSNKQELYEYLLKNICLNGTYTENDIIDGFIFRSTNNTYQFKVTEQEIESDNTYNNVKRMWREILLFNFVQIIHPSIKDYKNEWELNSTDYITRVCDLFVEFINQTEMFTKYSYKEDYFVPSWDKWLLDFNYNKISELNSNKSIIRKSIEICQSNPVHAAVLRFLIHTLRKHYTVDNFNNITTDSVDNLNEIIDAISYHNYSEIALAHLKVQEQIK